MTTQPEAERITVSLSTLRAELSQLELRLVDRFNNSLDGKADRAVQDQLVQVTADLRSRMQTIESETLRKDGPLVARVEAQETELANLRTLSHYRKWIWAQSIALVGTGAAVIGLVLKSTGTA